MDLAVMGALFTKMSFTMKVLNETRQEFHLHIKELGGQKFQMMIMEKSSCFS